MNLNTVITKTATNWKERAKNDRSNRRKITRSQSFALELLTYMDDNGIKQKELAQRMGVSPQQVNKILRAKTNLTFETLDKIADALNVTITSPNIKKPAILVSSPPIEKMMQVVHVHKPKLIEEDVNTVPITKNNPVLKTTIENMDTYRYTAN